MVLPFLPFLRRPSPAATGRAELLWAASMPWFAVFSDVFALYLILGDLAVSSPVAPGLLLAALFYAVLPLAFLLLLLNPVLTVWILLCRGRVPGPVGLAQRLNLVLVAVFCLVYAPMLSFLGGANAGSDPLYAVGRFAVAGLLLSGAWAAVWSFRGLGRCGRAVQAVCD